MYIVIKKLNSEQSVLPSLLPWKVMPGVGGTKPMKKYARGGGY